MKQLQLAAMREARETLLIAAANFGGLAPSARDRCIRAANALHEVYTAQPFAEQARTEPDSFTLLARVRDALPVPERGSPLEQLWAAAMADPGSVPEYVRASLAQTHKAEDAPSDAAGVDVAGLMAMSDTSIVLACDYLMTHKESAKEKAVEHRAALESALRLVLAQRVPTDQSQKRESP